MQEHPETIRIYVTRRDIARGIIGSADRCPIALALTRRAGSASVGRETAAIDGAAYRLPPAARRFVDTFDRARDTAPTSFVLRRFVDL
jgi:hypothetical protein